MSIRHLSGREDGYIISTDHGDGSQRRSLHLPNAEASVEWNRGGKGFGYGFDLGRNGSESDLGLDLHFGPLASIWLRIRAPWTKWARVRATASDRYEVRKTGLRIHPWPGCLVEAKFEDRDGTWSSNQPWWRSMKLTTTSILGRTHVETATGATGTTHVETPEGLYAATWATETFTTNYLRFPGTLIDRVRGPRTHSHVDLSIPGGIPVEGKGENSYDCGMDGLFGTTGSTVAEAVQRATTTVERDRGRYGGPHNLPHPMTVSEAEATA